MPPSPMIHVGYAARTLAKFRYDNDPREVHLEISAAAVRALLVAATIYRERRGGRDPEAAALQQVEDALRELLADEPTHG